MVGPMRVTSSAAAVSSLPTSALARLQGMEGARGAMGLGGCAGRGRGRWDMWALEGRAVQEATDAAGGQARGQCRHSAGAAALCPPPLLRAHALTGG